ncbi:unnamed protein product [Closterium sp. NIES-54]
MEVARTSIIHAAAPEFLWPFAVRYAAHQLNLWPRVSLPETSPTLRWTGKVGDASMLWVWGSRAFVRDASADKLSTHAIPFVSLGFPPDAPGWQFYHPTSRRVIPSHDLMFDESVPFYRLFPYRSAPLPPLPLFLAPGPPPVDPLPPQGPTPSGVSQVDPLPGTVPVEVAGDSGATSGGVGSGGAEPGCAESEGAGSGGVEPGGAEHAGVEPGGAEPEGVGPGGAESEGAESGGAEPRAAGAGDSAVGDTRARGVGATRLGGAGVLVGAGGTGGAAAAGSRGACTRGTGAARTSNVGCTGARGAGAGDPVEPGGVGVGGTGTGSAGAGGAAGVGVGGTGAGGAGAGGAGAGATGAADPGAGGVGAGGAVSGGIGAGGTLRPRPYFVPLLQQSASPVPAPSPYTEQSGGLTECREPASRPVSPVRTARRVPCSRPPPVPSTHAMALRPSSVPLRVPLPPPPESSLPAVPDPESDLACAASPTVSRLLATVVTDPFFESTAASALVAKLLDFAAACPLDYAIALVDESESASLPSIGG